MNPALYKSQEKFLAYLEKSIQETIAQALEGGVLVLHLENYHTILDVYGNEFAESFLSHIFKEIYAHLQPEDAVLRMAPESWAILLQNCNRKTLQTRAALLRSTILEYCGMRNTADNPVYISLFMGGADFPRTATQPEDVLQKAYIAMKYALIERHYECVLYNKVAKTQRASKQDLSALHVLQKAMAEDRLFLAYQPIIDSRTGKTSYYESLLRILMEDGSITSAGPHIMLAEQVGMIEEIDHFVFDQVCKELKQHPEITLAMNVSGCDIEDAAWLQKCKRTLGQHPEVAERLIVEITETSLQKNLAKAAYFVANLQGLGCRVALDDFGCGNTSFRQLKALSVDIIKIDGYFVRDITENADNRLLVKVMSEICQGFGLKSVAEFVENGAIAQTLIDLKIDYLQGFHFSPPILHRPWVKGGG